MAIQVIDPNPHPSVVRQIICGNCGVTLSFVPKDQRTHVNPPITFIVCPICDTRVTTAEGDKILSEPMLATP